MWLSDIIFSYTDMFMALALASRVHVLYGVTLKLEKYWAKK